MLAIARLASKIGCSTPDMEACAQGTKTTEQLRSVDPQMNHGNDIRAQSDLSRADHLR